MSEYTDIKKRRHKVIQTVRAAKESREAAEQEIVEALLKIFLTQTPAK